MTAPVTLADVGGAAAAALGVRGFSDRIGLGSPHQVVVCLIDGLGWQSLQRQRKVAPFLAQMSGRSIAASFPTTTPVGLASLGTGLLAGEHGIVGASFELPDTGEVLAPLQWGHHPNPVAVQPEATIFEQVSRAGIRVTTLSPASYENSGLTRSVLRGAVYEGTEDAAARIATLRRILDEGSASLTYVYWGELDRVGHEHGVESPEWVAALARADALVAGLCAVLVPGAALVVTSDHGMVNCPERIVLDSDPRFRVGVRRWAGEPRVRHVYCEEGAAQDVERRWRDLLGTAADVLTREQIIDSGWLGPVSADLVDRIGDVVAVAHDHVMLASRVDATVSGLRGQHGGMTPDEVLIPALVCHAPA